MQSTHRYSQHSRPGWPAIPLIGVLALVALAAGIIIFLSSQSGSGQPSPNQVASFSDCLNAGYPVVGQGPRVCSMPGGKRFSEASPTEVLHNPCSVAGSCQFAITAKDNGRTLRYGTTSRFTVELDKRKYPAKELACAPTGIIGPISNVPLVAAPLFAARFQALQTGTCVLSDRGFRVTIQITD